MLSLTKLCGPPPFPCFPTAPGRFSDANVWGEYLATGLGLPFGAVPVNLLYAGSNGPYLPSHKVAATTPIGGARTGLVGLGGPAGTATRRKRANRPPDTAGSSRPHRKPSSYRGRLTTTAGTLRRPRSPSWQAARRPSSAGSRATPPRRFPGGAARHVPCRIPPEPGNRRAAGRKPRLR